MIKFNEKKYLSIVQKDIDKKTAKDIINVVVAFVRRNIPQETIEAMIKGYEKSCGDNLLAVACAYEQIAHQLVAYYKAVLKRLMEDHKNLGGGNKNVN